MTLTNPKAVDTFDPTRPDRLHEDTEAIMLAVESLAATFARLREYDGLEAEPEAGREHDELRERIADLIEVGASFDLVQDILNKRALARRKRPRR